MEDKHDFRRFQMKLITIYNFNPEHFNLILLFIIFPKKWIYILKIICKITICYKFRLHIHYKIFLFKFFFTILIKIYIENKSIFSIFTRSSSLYNFLPFDFIFLVYIPKYYMKLLFKALCMKYFGIINWDCIFTTVYSFPKKSFL